MERRLTVEFGPSRSKRFAKAVAAAQSGPGECQELEPGGYRVSFLLGSDAAVYVGLARLPSETRHGPRCREAGHPAYAPLTGMQAKPHLQAELCDRLVDR